MWVGRVQVGRVWVGKVWAGRQDKAVYRMQTSILYSGKIRHAINLAI